MKGLSKHRILTLLAGIATAAVIVFSQLFYFQAANYCQEKIKSEQSEQKAGTSENFISIPSSTISSSTQIVINQELSFVLEILFEDESAHEGESHFAIPIQKYFQTLFRFIISPNAP